eukprot:TRINITY_DN239_c0_g1_i9.p1 TRINITY_DN239_c0_g1~~TRINITY_DN239_c0_g1_i9.p1  ORF type:complete len:155 (-),score=17.12 TRINITY_DN239_c0_g1_i9:286-750(-)
MADTMDDARNAVVQATALSMFQSLKSKVSNIDWAAIKNIRWNTYAKMANPRNFARPPSSGPELFSRIQSNVRGYSSHYAFIYVLFFIYSVVTSPMSLVPIAIVAAVWYYVFYINPDISINGWQPNTLQKVAILGLSMSRNLFSIYDWVFCDCFP